MKSDGDLQDGEDADCHSQCAHWLRNDSFLQEMRWGGPMWASAPTDCLPIEFRRGRCPHRPGGTSFHVMRRAG